jgi:glutathione S-transferase
MITLYGAALTRSFRALWALEEAELPYDYIKIKLGSDQKNGNMTDDYRCINPQGKIPTLVDDQLVITESAAILNYIAMRSLNKNLMPIDDINLRAQYDEMCFFVLVELEQALWTHSKHHFVLPKGLRLPEIRLTAEYEFAKAIKALQYFLKNKDFAINNHFSMVDILISHTLHWAENAQFIVPDNLKNYACQMYERSACQRALQKA